MPAPLIFEYGDGSHSFDLAKIAQLQELQDKTGRGPQALLQRFVSGQWHIEELRETVRIALIGGGTKAADATVIVDRYLLERPLALSVKIAVAALGVLLVGATDEAGNAQGGASA